MMLKTLFRDAARHTDWRVAAVTVATILAAVTVRTMTPGYTTAVFAAAIVVMAVNLFYGVITYYRDALTAFLGEASFTPFTGFLFAASAVTVFTVAVYFSPVFAVAILGFLTGLAAVAFNDALAQHVTRFTYEYEPDWLSRRVLTVFLLLASVFTVLGHAFLDAAPGFAPGFFIGGLAAVVLVLAFLAAVTVWSPGVTVRGVELIEAGTYLAWFLPLSIGYVTFGVTMRSTTGFSSVPFIVVGAIFLFVFAVLSTALKRFGIRFLPMVNSETVGYVFLYFVSALTVIWLATALYGITTSGIAHIARYAAVTGAFLGVIHTLYKKYWLLVNREPWFQTTLKPVRTNNNH